MARRCAITGKSRLVGNKVSHSNIKSKKVQQANLQEKRFYSSEEGRFIRLRISMRGVRIINKYGFDDARRRFGDGLQ